MNRRETKSPDPGKSVTSIINDLDDITQPSGVFLEDTTKTKRMLERWEYRASRQLEITLGKAEANRFKSLKSDFDPFSDDDEYIDEARSVYLSYLEALLEDIKKQPDFYQQQTADNFSKTSYGDCKAGSLNDVFIIHGHDEANKLALARYIEKSLNLNTHILDESPGRGRTIIEKFEEEAEKCGYAFAVLTPDDIIKHDTGEYAQARPNVAFELGWFYGRLGRDRVCIILREGTKIHSDLQGVSQICFNGKINSKFEEVRAELESAGLL